LLLVSSVAMSIDSVDLLDSVVLTFDTVELLDAVVLIFDTVELLDTVVLTFDAGRLFIAESWSWAVNWSWMLLLILVAIVDLDLFTIDAVVLLNLLICDVISKLILFSLAKSLGNCQFSESVFSPFPLSVTPISNPLSI
jgi:hypothetical protein